MARPCIYTPEERAEKRREYARQYHARKVLERGGSSKPGRPRVLTDEERHEHYNTYKREQMRRLRGTKNPRV